MRSWLLWSLAVWASVGCDDAPEGGDAASLDVAVVDHGSADAAPPEDAAPDADGLDARAGDAHVEPDAHLEDAGFTCDGPPSARPRGALRVEACRLRRDGLDAPPRGVVLSQDSLDRVARTPLHEPQHFAQLAQHFDLVWLLVTWDGIEPQRGTYNGAYLGRICQQVEWAEAAGLEVVLGLYQRCWGTAIGGLGMPAWATPAGLAPSADPACDHPSVEAAWAGFWADHQDALLAAWVRLLETCADRPGIVGIQPLGGRVFGGDALYAAWAERLEAEAEARLGPLLVFHEAGLPTAPAADHLRTFTVGLPESGAQRGDFARGVAGAAPDALRAARAVATEAGAGAAVWIDGFGGSPLALRDEDGVPGPLWAAATQTPAPRAVAGSLIGWGPTPGGWAARWWADGRNEGVSRFRLEPGAAAPAVSLAPDGPFTWFSGYDPATGELTVFIDGDVGAVTLTIGEGS